MIAYGLVFVLAIGDAWQRNEEGLPPAEPWVETIRSVIFFFPFSYLGVTNDLIVSMMLNGLFWGGTCLALLRLCAGRHRKGIQKELRILILVGFLVVASLFAAHLLFVAIPEQEREERLRSHEDRGLHETGRARNGQGTAGHKQPTGGGVRQ